MATSKQVTPKTHAREALVLATMAEVWEPCLHHCRDQDVGPFVCTLDIIRDWTLGRATLAQVEAASRTAREIAGGTLSAPTRELLEARRGAGSFVAELANVALSSSDEETERSFLLIGYFASELDADTDRDRLGAPGAWGPVLESSQGLIVAGDYLWRPEEPGGWSGSFVKRTELTAEELVALDELLERQ